MKRARCTLIASLGMALSLTAPPSLAGDAGAPAAKVERSGPSTARASTDPSDNTEEADPHGHGAGGHGGSDGVFQAPPDSSQDDPSLPAGTLEIHIVDPEGKPLAGTAVTLGVLYNSVAKGESRKRLSVTANAEGVARVEHLETGSSVAYRPMVIVGTATFSVMPFRMPDTTGMRALLHVYPIVTSIESARVVTQALLYAEVKDDRIQIQEAFKVFNLGQSAWTPTDLVVALPPEFTAFSAQQGMSDIGAEAVPSKGVKIHGTFGPGQHLVEFRWQLPYKGDADVHFDIGMAPRTAAARVIAPASKDMKLVVPGFPPPQSTADGMGQRVLITEKQLRPDEAALPTLTVELKGLPTEGPAKIIATMLSVAGLALGIVLGAKRPANVSRSRKRAQTLDELADLERSFQRGEIGPKTYEKARADLMNELTQTFADEATSLPSTKRRGRAAIESEPSRSSLT